MEQELITAPEQEIVQPETVQPETVQQETVQPETVQVVDIQFRPGQKVYFFDPNGLELHYGDQVIIDTARGLEFGICTGAPHQVSFKDVVAPLRPVVRLATQSDLKIVDDNRAKERKAHELCQKKIADLELDMQLVSVECAFDNSKLLFFFTADERVDFRDLVKSLAFAFHTRIELRQIGVRDKAKMVGGLGICGRPFCCSSFLDDFQPVSIKMAKTQNLSLNPTKISGTCGRLMCCLKYEQEAYEDLLRRSPKEESFVDTPEGRGTVIEVSLLRQKVKVRMEDDPDTISVFSVDEIAILRNGKAKKNDPPIPADLAPISGNGKRQRQEPVQETGSSGLDSIKFRYIQETIAEKTTVTPSGQAGTEEAHPHRRRRNRPGKPHPHAGSEEAAGHEDRKKPENKKPAPKKPAPPVSGGTPGESPVPPADSSEEKKRPNYRRRPNFHHRRRPKPEGGKPTE